ncbi:POU domain class 2-associating factor 1 isoform X2 [Gambusia affinis]|uniref:POU domain class 2-associating factor 1 isoform X2 n=1 Tax=Gambusia affinis TaxID=33528 RepID=UPI001CDB90EA|nr:POU domain class 2-associating factor 1 isoform X2 [Gambusia affinis]
MHWEKSQPSAQGRSRPYQGVRVRDPVKELLRRKRSLEHHSTKTTHFTADVVGYSNQSSFIQDVASASPAEQSPGAADRGLQGAGWKPAPPITTAGLQPAVIPWSSSDYNQQDSTAQTLAYPAASALTADVYMQTLCPSYTMLTYTHTPLLTNFGTIPVAQGQSSLAPMELPDSGLAYPLWAQPLTTISAMPNPGVQFASETQVVDPHPQIRDTQQHSGHELDQEPQDHSLAENPEEEPVSPNLLDKLLEDQKRHDEEEDKNSYSSSMFLPNV